MRKKITTVVAALMAATCVFGQISTGEPHSSVIPRTGNRPQAGDWGFYLGVSASQITDMVKSLDAGKAWYGLPLINFKYYISDPLELRIGMQTAVTTFSETTTMNEGNASSKSGNYEGYNFTRFTPGVAYHFSRANLVDVYAGAELPIGWETEKRSNRSLTGRNTTYTGEFVIGGGLFLGFQVFIADLPLAIGFETGMSGLIRAGGNTKHTNVYNGEKQVYWTKPEEESLPEDGTSVSGDEGFGKISTVRANWGGDVAITFSYYFK